MTEIKGHPFIKWAGGKKAASAADQGDDAGRVQSVY